jgi:uncharacterized protein (AIM24 family)
MQSTLQQFAEKETGDAFSLHNHKLLKVELRGNTIRARQGSMVAYQGEVSFDVASAGVGRLVKKVMTGEGLELMTVSGTGEVFLAHQAEDVHVITLEDETVTVNARNLLAFQEGIEWDVKRVTGGANAMAGGLFQTTLTGSGTVAIVSDGPPILFDVASAPTFADAQAAIVWSSGVTTQVHVDAKLSSLLRGGSGETVQIAFGGSGWLLVQPSEGRVEGDNGRTGGQGLGGGLGRLLSG